MSVMNKLKGMLGKHSDRIQQGVDRAAEAADKRTRGKYGKRIGTAREKAKEYVAKHSGHGGEQHPPESPGEGQGR